MKKPSRQQVLARIAALRAQGQDDGTVLETLVRDPEAPVEIGRASKLMRMVAHPSLIRAHKSLIYVLVALLVLLALQKIALFLFLLLGTDAFLGCLLPFALILNVAVTVAVYRGRRDGYQFCVVAAVLWLLNSFRGAGEIFGGDSLLLKAITAVDFLSVAAVSGIALVLLKRLFPKVQTG